MDCQFDRESLGLYPESQNFNDKCLFIQEDCWELWEKENRQSPKENEDPFLKKQGKFQKFFTGFFWLFLTSKVSILSPTSVLSLKPVNDIAIEG